MLPKFTVDGIEYNTEDLDERATAEFKSLQFTELQINKLEQEIAALKTARAVYLVQLKAKL